MGYRKNKKELVANFKGNLARYYMQKRFCCSTEVGLCKRGRYRADFIALNMKREIVIVECKSCLADFRADKKWQKYLKYCNKFYFCLSSELYKKIQHELPDEVGVFIDGYYIAKAAKRLDMDPLISLDILTRLAFRSSEYNRLRRE